MKTALIAGWLMFAVEVAVVVTLYTAAESGDAAGRGMAKGFALLASPFVLVAGALLLWGQFTRHPWGIWGGSGLTAVPFAVGLVLLIPNLVPNFGRMFNQASAGKFDDARLTAIARAINSGDYAKERELVKAGPVDWPARDRHGVTLLGIAVNLNMDPYAKKSRMEGLRILLEAGAPLAADALRPDSEAGVASRLMVAAFGTQLDLLEALLAAGGDANATDEQGEPLAFMSYVSPEKLKLLLKYGLNKNAIDPDPMHEKRSLLMHYAFNDLWEEAKILAESGADVAYTAPNGQTLASILAEKGSDHAKELGQLVSAR